MAIAGLALGAAAGVAVGRRLTAPAPAVAVGSGGLVDWDRVRRLAVAMHRGEALTAAARARLDGEYRDLVAAVLPEVCAYTGLAAADVSPRTRVVDRPSVNLGCPA